MDNSNIISVCSNKCFIVSVHLDILFSFFLFQPSMNNTGESKYYMYHKFGPTGIRTQDLQIMHNTLKESESPLP